MAKNGKKEEGQEKPESQASQIKLTGAQVVQLYENERAKLEAIERRMGLVQRSLEEVVGAIETIRVLTKSSEKDSVLLPIGAGIYVEGNVENKGSLKASIPGGIVLELTVDETKIELEKRKDELLKDQNMLEAELQKSAQAVNQLATLLQMGQQKAQEAAKQRTGVV